MVLLCVKGFMGGAVGAYFGNHLSSYRGKKAK